MTALNSDDLRVRAAAIEIDLAYRNVEKTTAAVDRMEQDARSGEQGPRTNALWDIALLGNRGIEPERSAPVGDERPLHRARRPLRVQEPPGPVLADPGPEAPESHRCVDRRTVDLQSGRETLRPR